MTVMLALDTSTRIGAVAVGAGGEILAESLLEVRATHSESVLPEIRRLFREAGRSLDDLSEVVVGSGPGSFTGVRIAASFAKGLCYARSIPLYAFSSLAAIAAGIGDTRPVCAVIDARRGQVYAAGYEFRSGFVQRFGPVALAAASIPGLLPADEPWVFAGDGLDPIRGEAAARGWEIADAVHAQPRASALLSLAARFPAEGLVPDVGLWEPGYVRDSSAVRSRR